ncbi:MAG TPA: hypothetical protein VHX13_13125, partial [Acidobacteriaceae bacterium]|nr:hypothetical protein [Acidobacteriaceae bacterium]
FTGGQLSSIVERFIAQYPGSAALYLAIASINCRDSQALAFNPPSLDKIHPDRLSLASVIRNVRQEEWHNAISSSRTLLNSPIPSVGREAARILSGSLLEIGDVHDAAEFIVSAVLRDENLCYQLPISATIQAITKEYRHRFVGDLSTPIIFDLLRNRPGSVESNRTYAYEDFLFAHNLERPSQLADHLEGFDPVQLTYYLRHLCTTDTMQMSIAFAGTRECEDERIKVCTLLASIDSTNTKTYEAESRAIMQSQVIRMGVSQVEENKIYVDESALRKWATMNLRESYARYQALRSANKDGERSDVMDAIRSALQAVAPTTLVLAVPENESSDLLVVMLEKLVTEFLSSAQHGLDSYLSMRVRHGSLAGTLRYPLETNGVITQREGQSNQYTANEYWLYRLPDLSSTETRAVHRALQEFSRAYDDLIDDYSSNYVQVRGEAKPQGLFDLPITEGIILYLSNNFYPDTPLDAFLDYAFAYMREAVDRCLERVREHIDTHLGTRADAVVERLEGELATVGIDRVHELDAAVHVAHTELRRTIQDIKKWFYRGERTSEGEFRFEELVRIGLMCVTRIHEDFEPRLTISWTRDDLTFKDIGLFADLFVIIFDNIRIHSGVEAPQVSVTAKLEGRILLLTVRSAVAVGHVTEAKRERVRQIRDAILAGRSHRGTRTEGGTGLKKLRNILGWQIGPSDPLEFHFDEDENEFVVKCAVVVI